MFDKLKIFSATLLTSIMFSASAYAADSTITIKGNVKDNTCAVAPGSQNQVVDLLNNAVRQLYAIGEVTPLVPFQIELTPCGGVSISRQGRICGHRRCKQYVVIGVRTRNF